MQSRKHAAHLVFHIHSRDIDFGCWVMCCTLHFHAIPWNYRILLRFKHVVVQEWVHLHQDSFSRISGSKLLDVVGLCPRLFRKCKQTWSDSIQVACFSLLSSNVKQVILASLTQRLLAKPSGKSLWLTPEPKLMTRSGVLPCFLYPYTMHSQSHKRETHPVKFLSGCGHVRFSTKEVYHPKPQVSYHQKLQVSRPPLSDSCESVGLEWTPAHCAFFHPRCGGSAICSMLRGK